MSGERAVVIGASIAGLLAARVLKERFREVILLERDRFPAPGQYRKGVPQARHAHVLLSTGKEAIERLLPGTVDRLVAAGALLTDATGDIRWYEGGGYHCHFSSGITSLMVSRPLLEEQIREQVLALPGVRAEEDCDVTGLVASANGDRVTGVRLIRRQSGRTEEVLTAGLVVDTAGRGSQLAAWLKALGYEAPEKEKRRIDMSYASRIYRRSPEQRLALVIGSTPEQKRAGAMLPLEGDRYVVTLAGMVGVQPPLDHEGFLAYARSLPAPDIYNAIAGAEPLSEIAPYRFPANRRLRYDRLRRFPEGLLVCGDALASFNPLYGQGITIAALEARALQETLAAGMDRLSERFFRGIQPILESATALAAGADLRYPEVEGKRGLMFRLTQSYLRRLYVAARHDPEVVLAYRRVTDLAKPPETLMQPRLLWRVLTGARRGAARTAAQSV